MLRSKGCADASTIHSMIYRSRESDEGGPQFVLNRQSAAAKADLIIIDECSMVDEELGRDLLSFGQPVLVLGDPAQLPPVKGGGFFTEAEPDVMLTEVHRQAKDNPIIQMSLTVREGGRLRLWHLWREQDHPSQRDRFRRSSWRPIRCWSGSTSLAASTTRRLRELNGYRNPMPAAGEKLVCLRNDKTKGLLNGGTWNIQALHGIRNDFIRMDVLPDGEASEASRWRYRCTRPSSKAPRRTFRSRCGGSPTSSHTATR